MRSRGVTHAPQFTYALCGSGANDLPREGAASGSSYERTCILTYSFDNTICKSAC